MATRRRPLNDRAVFERDLRFLLKTARYPGINPLSTAARLIEISQRHNRYFSQAEVLQGALEDALLALDGQPGVEGAVNALLEARYVARNMIGSEVQIVDTTADVPDGRTLASAPAIDATVARPWPAHWDDSAHSDPDASGETPQEEGVSDANRVYGPLRALPPGEAARGVPDRGGEPGPEDGAGPDKDGPVLP